MSDEKTTTTTAVAKAERRSVVKDMAERFGMEIEAFEATIRASVMPSGATREQMAAFLLVAKEYNLNPLTKEIYAFPTKGGGIQPMVPIDGWIHLANSHPMFDGMEFEDHVSASGELTAITAVIYRRDRRHPVKVTEYMHECKQNTEPWRKWSARMLRHKAAIQGIRYAFGFSGIMDDDEYQRMMQVEQTIGISEPAPTRTSMLVQKLSCLTGEVPAQYDESDASIEEPECVEVK